MPRRLAFAELSCARRRRHTPPTHAKALARPAAARAGTRRVTRSFLLRRFAFIDRVYGKARGPGAVAIAPKRPIFRAADGPGDPDAPGGTGNLKAAG
jgi:hypothetical protein